MFYYKLMLLEYNLGPSPPAITLKLYTSIPHSKLKDRLRELIHLCFIKRIGQRTYIQIPCARKGQVLLCEKNTDFTKKSLKLISTCSRF